MERASKRGDKSFYGKRERARKSAFLKAEFKEGSLCRKPSTPRIPFAGRVPCSRNPLPKESHVSFKVFMECCHLLGRIHFSKSSRDTAHCEKLGIPKLWVQSAYSHAALTHSYPDSWTSCVGPPLQATLDRRAWPAVGLGGNTAGPPSSSISSTTGSHGASLRVGPGSLSPQVFRYSLQKLAHTVSRTGRQVLGERRQQAPN